MKKSIIASLMIMSFGSHADISEILPESYSFSHPTSYGSYSYADETGLQLIDGVVKTDPSWSAQEPFGNPIAYETVAWWGIHKRGPYTVDFQFSTEVSLSSFSGSFLNDHGAAIFTPDVNIYSKGSVGQWDLEGSYSASFEDRGIFDKYKDVASIALNATGDEFRVEMIDSGFTPHRYHYWVFTDEMDFFGMEIVENVSGSSLSDVGAPALIGGFSMLLLSGLFTRRKK